MSCIEIDMGLLTKKNILKVNIINKRREVEIFKRHKIKRKRRVRRSHGVREDFLKRRDKFSLHIQRLIKKVENLFIKRKNGNTKFSD